jgi:hypothetical protein
MVWPAWHAGAGHAFSVQAHCPFEQLHVLQPSGAAIVSPVRHCPVGGQARSVQTQLPSGVHEQALQPSLVDLELPGSHEPGVVDPPSTGQAFFVHDHVPPLQEQALQPSSAAPVAPSEGQALPGLMPPEVPA